MKSAIAAFVSVVLGVLVGWAAFGFFAPGGYSGRDPRPVMAFAALFLVVSGFVYGRWWLAGGLACAAGLAAYGVVVGALVPWELGVFAGKWARRIQFTP